MADPPDDRAYLADLYTTEASRDAAECVVSCRTMAERFRIGGDADMAKIYESYACNFETIAAARAADATDGWHDDI